MFKLGVYVCTGHVGVSMGVLLGKGMIRCIEVEGEKYYAGSDEHQGRGEHELGRKKVKQDK
jgi:hypothetical protein